MISFDNSSSSSGNAISSLTWSHTVNSNANGILIVGVDIEGGATITGITYNSVALTPDATLGNFLARGSRNGGLWYLMTPSTGANNVVVTLSGSSGNGLHGAAVSYTGVKQTGFPDAEGNANANPVTTNTQSITTTVDNAWLVGFFLSGATQSASTNTTIRTQTSVNDLFASMDTNAAQTPAGSHSLNTTMSSSYNATWAVSIAPSLAVATGSTMELMGVG